MTRLPLLLRIVASLATLTAAVIQFIHGFSAHPLVDWSWTTPIAIALIATALTLMFVAAIVPDA